MLHLICKMTKIRSQLVQFVIPNYRTKGQYPFVEKCESRMLKAKWKKKQKSSCIQSTFLCSLVTVCSYCFAFLSATDGNVFRDRQGIAFLFLFPNISFLKSPLTALIVTGFCCFSVSKHACTKKAHWDFGGEKNNKPCECSVEWLWYEFIFPKQNKGSVPIWSCCFFYSSVC